MTKRKPFNIERVREFCKLVNEGKTPQEALKEINACQGYYTPLKDAGLFWKEKDGTFKSFERVYKERYNLFNEKKFLYNKSRLNKKPIVKQPTLFSQPKTKQTTPVRKEVQLSFIQRVVKSLFKL